MSKHSHTTITDNLSHYIIVGVTLALIAFAFYLFYRIMEPFIIIIFVAFIIAVIIYPLHKYLMKRYNIPTALSALIVVFLFLLCAIIPLSIGIFLLFNELRTAVLFMQGNLGQIETLEESIQSQFQLYLEPLGVPIEDMSLDIREYLLTIIQFLSQRLGVFISRTSGLVTDSIMTIIITYYFLVEKDRIISFISSVSPLKPSYSRDIQKKSVETIQSTIRGNLGVILLQGFVGFLGFLFFRVESPFLLGFVYGIFSIVPNIGAPLVWIPSTIYLIVTQGALSGFGFLAWCLSTNFIIDQFITPRLLGGAANLHPLLVLFAVLGGIQAFGLVGIILGPTIITLFFISLNIYKDLVTAK